MGTSGVAARSLAGPGMLLGWRIGTPPTRGTNDMGSQQRMPSKNRTAVRVVAMRWREAIVVEVTESGLSGSRRYGQRDRSVAPWVRLRRCALGLTQQHLGELIGVSCQQVEKYETGATRISAGRPQAIAEALSIDVGYFLAPAPGQSPGEPAKGLHAAVDLAGHFDLLPPTQQVIKPARQDARDHPTERRRRYEGIHGPGRRGRLRARRANGAGAQAACRVLPLGQAWPYPSRRCRGQPDRTTAVMTAASGSILAGHDPSWSVDRHVGAQLRARRLALGLIQQQLAGMLGVTYQQLQKYETGANRMTVERLLSVAQVLDVAVDYVFEHLDERWPALEARALLKLGRLLNAVARDHPEIVQAVLLAIAAEAAAAAGAAPAVRAGSPGAAAGTERGGMASPGRPWAGMERIPAAGRV
jgi:transcriptional regulator with XRE-family HTH domain